jgi:selenocysteine lyase/cysteine desulfurase
MNNSQTNFDHFYQDFNEVNPELIHMAGHSHHYWPDITKDAILEAYNDARTMVDLKWNKIFGEVIPETQRLMSDILNFSRPKDIAFAPNTHELLCRILSVFPNHQKKRILTTKHEFHSASRQFNRLVEEDDYDIHFVETDDLVKQLKSHQYDLIYVSHVFFDSGLVLPKNTIKEIIQFKGDALFLLDGYHSFCALPVDLKEFENDLFYLGGSYKYAQAGEGLCFMTLPKDCDLRPQNTGWFASFETLESPPEKVAYSHNGMRFSGATRDFTSHYRFNYIWNLFKSQQIDIGTIHAYVQKLQEQFLSGINTEHLLESDLAKVGHFLTFKTESVEHSKQLYQELLELDILTDFRGKSLRFGFGMHLNQQKIANLIQKLQKISYFS